MRVASDGRNSYVAENRPQRVALLHQVSKVNGHYLQLVHLSFQAMHYDCHEVDVLTKRQAAKLFVRGRAKDSVNQPHGCNTGSN